MRTFLFLIAVLSLAIHESLEAEQRRQADPLTLPSAFVEAAKMKRPETKTESESISFAERHGIFPTARFTNTSALNGQAMELPMPTAMDYGTHRAIPEYTRPIRVDSGFVPFAPVQSYSYGWFGVPPRQHWSRHFGYYRNYTEWSAK